MSDNPVQGMQENIEAAIHGAQSAFSSFTSSGGSSAGSSDVAGSSAGSSGDAEATAGSSAIHDQPVVPRLAQARPFRLSKRNSCRSHAPASLNQIFRTVSARTTPRMMF